MARWDDVRQSIKPRKGRNKDISTHHEGGM